MWGLNDKLKNLRRDVDWVTNQIRRINNLFAEDRHGTVRPKIDMLKDQYDVFTVNATKAVNALTERIIKLERK